MVSSPESTSLEKEQQKFAAERARWESWYAIARARYERAIKRLKTLERDRRELQRERRQYHEVLNSMLALYTRFVDRSMEDDCVQKALALLEKGYRLGFKTRVTFVKIFEAHEKVTGVKGKG